MTYMVPHDQHVSLLLGPSAGDDTSTLSSVAKGHEEVKSGGLTVPTTEVLPQIERLQQIVAELLLENERLRQSLRIQ
jgi:hypothetical protein